MLEHFSDIFMMGLKVEADCICMKGSTYTGV